MRISQDTANKMAWKMTENKLQEIEKLEKEIETFGYEVAKNSIKKEVYDFYLKHKNYFNKGTFIGVEGTGLTYTRLYFKPELPCVENGYNSAIHVDNKTANKINELFNKKALLKKERDKLILDIKNAILSLRTYAKVEAEFKEAAKHFPVRNKITTDLVINLSDIRKRL